MMVRCANAQCIGLMDHGGHPPGATVHRNPIHTAKWVNSYYF
jgi:hypothetical protein